MTPERWQKITEVFEAVLERQPNERSNFLATACSGDEELRAEVESLLSEHERAGSFIANPALASRNSMMAAGTRLGPYEILSPLGAGGMGEVYKAKDTRLKRHVALKLLPFDLVQNVDRMRRFEQEARAASGLNHPNIVTIHEIAESATGHFIVMEFVEGRTLRQIADAQPCLESSVQICGQVAKALGVAHTAGIVHRDIKPENIMVRGDGYAKVLDFGLARLSHEDLVASTRVQTRTIGSGSDEGLTAPGVVLGTLRYMSPEQAAWGTCWKRNRHLLVGSHTL